MSRQLNLFEANLNTGPRLKAAMREAIRKPPLSRELIAERMRHAAAMDGLGGGGRGSTISLANLDAWCSESHPNLIPVNLLTIFCKVTGTGYSVSQRIRKRVEEIYGSAKTVGVLKKTRHRGTKKVGWDFIFAIWSGCE